MEDTLIQYLTLYLYSTDRINRAIIGKDLDLIEFEIENRGRLDQTILRIVKNNKSKIEHSIELKSIINKITIANENTQALLNSYNNELNSEIKNVSTTKKNVSRYNLASTR